MNIHSGLWSFAAAMTLWSSAAFADLKTSFSEGAPKDRFTFSNTSNCNLENAKVTLDLSGSASGLIFDVTGKGAGVEVFQPLQIVSGASALASVPKVKDGDNRIVFNVKRLNAGEEFAFTIDVDDTTGGREITVNGSEISGASVKLSSAKHTGSGRFGSNAKSTFKMEGC